MAEVKLIKTDLGYYDIGLDANGDLLGDDGFATSIVLSLFSDKRADESEVAESHLRRGWWGNLLNEDKTFEIGSKLWLLDQERATTATANIAKDYTYDCLQWLLNDNHVKNIVVNSTLISNNNISIEIIFTKPDNSTQSISFTLWENTTFE
jgi:phage gp46-like protein